MDDIADLIGEARGNQLFDKFRTLMGEFRGEEVDKFLAGVRAG